MMTLALVAVVMTAESPVEQEEVLGPHDAYQSFLELAHRARFTEAAAYLALERIPAGERAERGERLARRLMFILDKHVEVPSAVPPPGVDRAVIAELPLGKGKVPVELVRHRGEPEWRFSTRVVQAVDPLFSEHGSVIFNRLPDALVAGRLLGMAYWQWVGLAVVVLLAFVLSRVVVAVLTFVVRRLTKLTSTQVDDQLAPLLRAPAWVVIDLLMTAAGVQLLALPVGVQSAVNILVAAGMTAAVAWALLRTNRVVMGALAARGPAADPLARRGFVTRLTVLRRVLDAVILVVGGAVVLLQFPYVRNVGVSLLASAGVVGVVVGLAAQRSIGSLLAGIQLSFTEPVRIGDTVVVEGEFGWVEEITLTYVVVKVWDLRRLVIPISNFLEKPFQNWTRSSSDILGTVMLYADYSVDVAAARAELDRLVQGQRGTLWDGKAVGLQVTDLSERTVTLRALVSAEDAGKAWDLRCFVREQMLAWLTRTESLPRLRTELPDGVGPARPQVQN